MDSTITRQARQLKSALATLNRMQILARTQRTLLEESADLNLSASETDGVFKVGARISQKMVAEIERTKNDIGEALDLRDNHI